MPVADTMAAPAAPSAREFDDDAGSVRFLPVEALHTSYARLRPGARRVRPDDTAALPLRVAPCPDGGYEVIDGLKRLARWKEAGQRRIPVVVESPGDAPAHKRRLLVTNAPPRTTTALDEAEVVVSLLDEDGFTPARVARFLGHGADWVCGREAIGRRLGPAGRHALAREEIGATFARALCAVPKKDQDALVGAVLRHGLGDRDAVVLVKAYRAADETDRKALLAAPMDAVRPQAPSPTLTPRAVTLERQLLGHAESLRALASFTLPDDLAPAERRRLEAVRRGVLAQLATTATTLGVAAPLPDPTTQEKAHVRSETDSPTPAPGTDPRRAARRGDPGGDPPASRPRARHPEDPGPPGRVTTVVTTVLEATGRLDRATTEASKLRPFHDAIASGWSSISRILRELQTLGYQGGRTILADHVRPLRAKLALSPKPGVKRRFETPPGQEMQIDWSIAGLCAAHACLDDQALLAAREAIGSSLQTLGSVYAVLLAFVVFVVWQQFNDARGFVEKEYALHGPRLSRDRG
jgi:ParB-like chromosome segregation protein Spo0J